MTDIPSNPTQAELTELEIGAFMGPHIKRARIALLIVGALYMLSAYLNYDDVQHLRDLVHRYGGGSPQAHEAARKVDLVYYFVIFTGIAGLANIILAAIASTKATVAMYAAVAILAAHTLFQIYLGGIGFLLSWEWWLMTIVVGMGFQAAWKADQLRKERAPAQAIAL